MNRLGHLLHRPLIAVLALFGFVHGGIDPGAAAPTTAVALLAVLAGKPAGVALGFFAVTKVLSAPVPQGVTGRDLAVVAALCGACFTVPALAVDRVLPGGAMAEAARLGLALSALAGLAAVPALRRWRRG
jgi:NhaA family Na+:H+ antiporter